MSSLSKRTRWRVLDRDCFTCQYCGRTAPNVYLEVDHIEPRSRGGLDDESNLIAACYDCNRGKEASDASEALQMRNFFADLNADVDAMTDAYMEAHRAGRQLSTYVEVLVYELAYQRGHTEGDVWDWLRNEVEG
jgi:hypothetical protein